MRIPTNDRRFPLSRPRRQRLALAVSAILAQSALLPGAVLAQTTDEAKRLDTVTVTATRRAESVQQVPLNITALAGDNLREEGISSLVDIGRSVPGLFVLD